MLASLHLLTSLFMLFPIAMGSTSDAEVKKQPSGTPVEEEQVELRESIYYIDVISATWGQNCHGKKRTSKYGTMDLHNHKKYEIETNNVLNFVQELCNDKQTCEVKNIESFYKGLNDPAENCKKHLNLSFRCFNYDVARTLELNHNSKVTLDCNLDEE